MWLRQMVAVRAAAISGDTEIGIGLLQTKYRGTFAKRQSRPRGIEGAALNVRINLGSLKDENVKNALRKKVQEVGTQSDDQFKKIYQVVEKKLA